MKQQDYGSLSRRDLRTDLDIRHIFALLHIGPIFLLKKHHFLPYTCANPSLFNGTSLFNKRKRRKRKRKWGRGWHFRIHMDAEFGPTRKNLAGLSASSTYLHDQKSDAPVWVFPDPFPCVFRKIFWVSRPHAASMYPNSILSGTISGLSGSSIQCYGIPPGFSVRQPTLSRFLSASFLMQ